MAGIAPGDERPVRARASSITFSGIWLSVMHPGR
jgi:hypothetical protein